MTDYLKYNVALVQKHGFSLTELEEMYPWERLVYIDIILSKLKEETESQIDDINRQKDLMSLRAKLNG